MGLKPYWGTLRPKPCAPKPPSGTPGMPAAIAGGGATIGVAPSAEDSGPAGAAPVQLGGTDSGPTMAARPTPADTALPKLPMPLMGPATA